MEKNKLEKWHIKSEAGLVSIKSNQVWGGLQAKEYQSNTVTVYGDGKPATDDGTDAIGY